MKKMIFLKVKNSYNKKLVTWLDLNLQVALLLIFIIFFQGCATWSGVKQDSKTAWQATKDTTTEVVKDVKKSIHEATDD